MSLNLIYQHEKPLQTISLVYGWTFYFRIYYFNHSLTFMMDNITTFRIELDVAAQKVINQFMMHNQHIEDQIRNAIQSAVESFDFEKEIRSIAQGQLREAVRDAMNYSVLEKLVREKTQSIYNELIEKEFSKFK